MSNYLPMACRFCKLQKGQTALTTSIYRLYHSQRSMKCLALKSYANSISELDYDLKLQCPTERDLKPDEALIKVHAASLNPIDIEMAKGYGNKLINELRKQANVPEFPLILGRDFSGTIVKRGKKFRRFQLDEPVYGVRFVVGQGTHAEYVIANKHEIAPKPSNIDFVEATSFPYVACTAWFALVGTGAVPQEGNPKRVLIPAGTGGVGSFAAQLCQNFGHDVVTTCASDAVALLENLGLKKVIPYDTESYRDDLKAVGPFDVILDTLNEQSIDFFKELLKPSITSHYVTLRPSILPETDRQGLGLGLISSGSSLIQANINQLTSGKGVYSWGLFRPNALVLNNVNSLIQSGKIKPLVGKMFDINDVFDAYLYAERGHARGKTIITM